jgi:competence protein ComEA
MTLVAGGVVAAPRQESSPSSSADGLPDDAGRDATVKVCGGCHEARRAASVRLTREGWAFVIEDMVKRGAKGTDEELGQVLEYLSTHFLGEAPRPINVNIAPQIDLESVIGLLRSEAAALVAYREKNGPCKTIDDLKKVSGLDFKKIEAAKDRIVCF